MAQTINEDTEIEIKTLDLGLLKKVKIIGVETYVNNTIIIEVTDTV